MSTRDSESENGTSGTGSRVGSSYQGAVEAVGAILVAAGIGFWLDQRFGSAPGFLLGGLAVGFAAFVLRLMRMRRLLEAPPDGDDASQIDAPPHGPRSER